MQTTCIYWIYKEWKKNGGKDQFLDKDVLGYEKDGQMVKYILLFILRAMFIFQEQ